MQKSLSGLRVLDLTSYLSGPFATHTLAGLGAEVIKIERRDGGDPSRDFPPFAGPSGMALRTAASGDDISVAILKRHRGKQGVTLSLDVPRGRDLFLRLVEKSDVVIENLAPGVLEKWHLTYEDLSKVNPKIVFCSISGYGRSGPKAKLPAFDPIVQASSLTMATNGDSDRAPTRTGISIGDTVPALYAVIGILAAVRESEKTGKGQHVDIAMHDSLAAMLLAEPIEAQVEWGFPLRSGSRILRLAPCNVYRCKDGYVALNASPPRLWKRLARLLGDKELADPGIEPLEERLARSDQIDRTVAKWASGFTCDELLDLTNKNGVPCARVIESLDEFLSDEHMRARQMLQPVVHPRLGELKGLYAAAVPVMSPGETVLPPSRAPMLGEHTREVLGRYLDLTEAELDDLQKAEII